MAYMKGILWLSLNEGIHEIELMQVSEIGVRLTAANHARLLWAIFDIYLR